MMGRYRLVIAVLLVGGLVSACGDDGGVTNPPGGPGSPTATITAPTMGSTYTEGQRVEFRGTATDDEDGVLGDAALAWSSNRDGAIGAGSSLDYNELSVGAHTVTLTATDSDGLRDTAQVSLTVNEVPTLPPVPGTLVLLQDDMDDENGGVATTNYTGFTNWNVTRQCVDLHGPGSIDPVPGNGLYIDMDGSCETAGAMESKTVFDLQPGNYRLELVVAGNNQNGPTDTMEITVGSVFSDSLVLAEDESFQIREWTFTVASATTGTIVMDHAGGDKQGILIDAIRLRRN